MQIFIKLFLVIMLLPFIIFAHAEKGPLPAQVLMNIYQTPSPLKANDQYFLVYEIYLTNYMKSDAKIISFEIDSDNKKLLSLNDLSDSIQARRKENQGNNFIFNPGETKTIYIWLPFDKEADISKKLSHRLRINADYKNKNYAFDMGSYSITVNPTLPIIVSPPLHGNNWLAGNGPSNTSDHRRTAVIANGKPYYEQRYAIDFVQMGKDGKSYSGGVHQNTSYHAYNQDLHAVAAGKVVQLQDGIPENIPNSNQLAVPISEKTLPGNYIVIDIGNGKFAQYAHIKPGSFKVKLGDHVRQDQVIAKLGNSGNSTEPHLHFQITNNESFIESEGVPYGFNHFFAHPTHLLTDPSGSMKIKIDKHNFKEYFNQLVLENALINF